MRCDLIVSIRLSVSELT